MENWSMTTLSECRGWARESRRGNLCSLTTTRRLNKSTFSADLTTGGLLEGSEDMIAEGGLVGEALVSLVRCFCTKRDTT